MKSFICFFFGNFSLLFLFCNLSRRNVLPVPFDFNRFALGFREKENSSFFPIFFFSWWNVVEKQRKSNWKIDPLPNMKIQTEIFPKNKKKKQLIVFDISRIYYRYIGLGYSIIIQQKTNSLISLNVTSCPCIILLFPTHKKKTRMDFLHVNNSKMASRKFENFLKINIEK